MWRKEVLVVALVAICAIMLFASLPASDAVETGGGSMTSRLLQMN